MISPIVSGIGRRMASEIRMEVDLLVPMLSECSMEKKSDTPGKRVEVNFWLCPKAGSGDADALTKSALEPCECRFGSLI
jgi:hypothetical protein